MGYLGGGILLAINIVMIQQIPGTLGARLSFLSVAIWWAVFSIPIFRRVPEPHAATEKLQPGESLIGVSFSRIRHTFKDLRQFRELFRYLVSFLIYNDGIGIIIGIAVIYGAELGFETTELILALLLVQFVGIPFSLVFGNLPSKGDKRQSMYLAFVLFNIVLLPIVGVVGMQVLPRNITGTPSPDFAATATAVGQGKYPVDEAGTMAFQGGWETAVISGDVRGQTCAWYAFNCDPAQFDVTYATTAVPGARLYFAFNGQGLKLTISNGPDHGRWAVEMDGQPLLDDDGQPIIIDAYSPTVRYDVVEEFRATAEGEHLLSLVNTGQANPDSSGTVMSVAQIEVRPPLRSSNLGAIVGLILALQVIGGLFAYFLGPRFFAGLAEKFDTKRSIMLALVAYSIIAVWGFFLNAVIEFWFLAWMVAIVQGGSQALSRSLYASMSPPSMSGEFFGLFSIMEKFASFISPIFFIISVALFNSSRPGILSIIILFIIGGYLLSRVDVAEGRRVAQEKELQLARS
jgi:MFS-type transporter involved in bile tolerance (Atg22 family)